LVRAVEPPMAPVISLRAEVELMFKLLTLDTEPPIEALPEPELMVRE
jgi:hypothetical protein